MSTLIVTGSPREGMYSDRMGEMYRKITDGKLYHLRDYKIGPCHACDYCKEINIGECIQRDDMAPLYKDIRECDTIAIFSPVYWWQVSAQAKLFIDRLYALQKEDLEGKKLVVVVNGEEKDGDREYQVLNSAFLMMADYLKMDLRFLGLGTDGEESWKDKEKWVEEFLQSTLN